MKKTLLLAVAVIGLTSVACRKERTCTCKTTETTVVSTPNGPETTVTTTSETYTKEKQYKNQFRHEQHCYSEQYTTISGDGKTQTTDVVDCELK